MVKQWDLDHIHRVTIDVVVRSEVTSDTQATTATRDKLRLSSSEVSIRAAAWTTSCAHTCSVVVTESLVELTCTTNTSEQSHLLVSSVSHAVEQVTNNVLDLLLSQSRVRILVDDLLEQTRTGDNWLAVLVHHVGSTSRIMSFLSVPVVHLTLFLKLEHVTVLFVIHPQVSGRTFFQRQLKLSNVVLSVTRELV